jgi:hypothetical protein
MTTLGEGETALDEAALDAFADRMIGGPDNLARPIRFLPMLHHRRHRRHGGRLRVRGRTDQPDLRGAQPRQAPPADRRDLAHPIGHARAYRVPRGRTPHTVNRGESTSNQFDVLWR